MILVVWLLVSCTTQKSKGPNEGKKPQLKEAKKQSTETKIKSIMQLTDDGESSQAVFSNSGNEVLFVSSHRESHEQSQVYLFDYISKKMSRITYSDGQVMHPFFSRNGDFVIYSSTTDEDKEQPDFSKLTGEKIVPESALETNILLGKIFPGLEIYLRRPKSDTIQRIRRAAGFDLAEDIDATGKKMLVTSHRSEKTEISIVDLNGSLLRSFNSYKSLYLPSPRFVPNPSSAKKSTEQEIVWVQLNGDNSKNIVITDKAQKQGRKIVSKNGEHGSLSVSADGAYVAFSSNFLNPENKDVFIAKTDGSCIEQITTDPTEDLFPSFSVDGKQLLVTSRRSGNFEVYLIDLNMPGANGSNPTCIPQ